MKKPILFLSLIFLASCQTESVKTIEKEGKYSITMPDYMEKANSKVSDISLNYQNIFYQLYLVVIEDSKMDFKKSLIDNNLAHIYNNDINGYTILMLESSKDKTKNTELSILTDTVINQMPSKFFTAIANIHGIKYFFYIAYIEGKNTYYQISTFTPFSEKTKNSVKMKKIIYSLKEI